MIASRFLGCSVAAHKAVSETLYDSGVSVGVVQAAGQILTPPAFVVAVIAVAVLVQQRAGFCFACGAQRKPPAPTATEYRGILSRDAHDRLRSGGLFGLLFLLRLSGLDGAVGVLGSPATGVALKVALANFNPKIAAVAGAGVFIAHGGLLGWRRGEWLPVGGCVRPKCKASLWA
ncbi:UNVERIFIED_ORG: hypothetical protein M2393_001982 [Pseudomonas psychrophila]